MGTSDDLPIFRPRFGSGRRPASGHGGAAFRNAVLSGTRLGARIGKVVRAVRARFAAPPPSVTSRRVVVKAHLVRLTASGAKAAALHVRYIERDGVEKDGSKGILYGATGPVQAETLEQPLPGEPHQFRLIVSPEDAGELDLTDYVRRYMARVESDLGRKLLWAAVNHHDTQHPHAHIVLRGVDADGRELRLDRSYVSHGLRWRAQEVATEELGPRRQVDIARTLDKEIVQDRVTSLDRELERRAKDGQIDIASLASRGRRGAPTPNVLVSRLEHLEHLGLAFRSSASTWSLREGWHSELRQVGERGDILKRIHAAMSGDPSRYHVLRPGEALDPATAPGGQISGRVASKGLADELRGSFFAVIETPAGRAYHVPLDARAADLVRPGDIVSLSTKPESPVRPVDHSIHAAAVANAGIYTPGSSTSAAADSHARRLRELEALGLATPLAPDRWRIAPDLLARLQQQPAADPPRQRLLVQRQPLPLAEQVRHPGPVWLDRVRTQELASYGLGAHLQRLVEQRRDALRALGIEPGDSNRAPKLRELERRAVGKEFAASSGQAFVDRPAAPMRGRVHLQDAAPGRWSQPYAIVSDGQRFVVLRSTPALRASQGKTVEVERDAKGRLTVRPALDRER